MANFADRPGGGRGSASRSPMSREIDANLKRVYQSALSDEVPDRFKALLDALKEKEAPAQDAAADTDSTDGTDKTGKGNAE